MRGLYLIDNFSSQDERGCFVKDFHYDDFTKERFNTNFVEMYYSTSHKGVIRGMHFQIPPHHHDKLVNVVQGAIVDVVVYLRKNSHTLGQYASFELNQDNHYSLYIPKGFAHGFMAIVDNTIVSYKVSTIYNPASDCGLRYDSIGFDWGVKNPIISKRDLKFTSLDDIITKNYFDE